MKKYILKNVGTQTVTVFCQVEQSSGNRRVEVNGNLNWLPTFFKMSSFIFYRRKFETILGWVNYNNFHFWVNHPFKFCDVALNKRCKFCTNNDSRQLQLLNDLHHGAYVHWSNRFSHHCVFALKSTRDGIHNSHCFSLMWCISECNRTSNDSGPWKGLVTSDYKKLRSKLFWNNMHFWIKLKNPRNLYEESK